MDIQALRSQLPSLVQSHVPRNTRMLSWQFFDGRPPLSARGLFLDPIRFVGTVIVKINDVVVVKSGRTEFAVLDRGLVTLDPDVGVQVAVTPYARRRFDGQRADTPEDEQQGTHDGATQQPQRPVFSAAIAKLPIPAPTCFALRHLIRQLEEQFTPDGYRRITHMLVDAGARDFKWTDPLPGEIVTTPPAINFFVSTKKFTGRVSVFYDTLGDLYTIELHSDAELIVYVRTVSAAILGQTLSELIDDGTWRRIQVECLTST